MQQAEVRHHQAEAVEMAEPQNAGLAIPPENPDMAKLFRLSDQERRWSLELKAAVESSDELENLTDLQYVQFALVFKGELEVTLERVAGFQAFRQEYNIKGTLEEGLALAEALTRYHPKLILSVAYDDVTENYGLIYDRSCLDYQKMQSQEEWRVMLGGTYHILNAFCPDPHSIRQGTFLIAECEGQSNQRMSIDALRQIWYHLLHHIPIYFRSVKFFHTNMVANLSYSMMKSFMRADIKDRITLGCQFGANLSTLYLLPTPEIATERTLRRLAGFMKKRFENEAKFSLS